MTRLTKLALAVAHAVFTELHSTKTIEQIQGGLIDRFEQGDQLSVKAWRTLIFFVEQGAATPRFDQVGLLRAFAALFEFRKHTSSPVNCKYYVSNLPCEIRGPLKATYSPSDVRHFTHLTLMALHEGCAEGLWPLVPGRSLSALLEFDRLADVRSVNAALRPYWTELIVAACLAFPVQEPNEAEPTR